MLYISVIALDCYVLYYFEGYPVNYYESLESWEKSIKHGHDFSIHCTFGIFQSWEVVWKKLYLSCFFLSSDEFTWISKFRITNTKYDCQIWSNSILIIKFNQIWPFKVKFNFFLLKFDVLKSKFDVLKSKFDVVKSKFDFYLCWFLHTKVAFCMLKLNFGQIQPNLDKFE